MRIRLERHDPIIRVETQGAADAAEARIPDDKIVTVVGGDTEVIGHATIAVEVEHEGMTASRLRAFTLDVMRMMVDMNLKTYAAPTLVDDEDAGSPIP